MYDIYHLFILKIARILLKHTTLMPMIAIPPTTLKSPLKAKLGQSLIKVVAIIALFLVAWLITDSIARLPPAKILVNPQGLSTQQRSQMQEVLGTVADKNLLQADLLPYQQKVQNLTWVAQTDIRRDWQNGMVVTATPRQAVAKFGSEKLVDATGHVFAPMDSSELTRQHWKQLQGDSQNAPLIMQQTEQVSQWFAPLGLKVEEVILTPRMTWLFRFDNGLRVLVDKDSTSEKLYQLSILLMHQLKPRLPNIQTIDLRYKNGMTLTWKSVPITETVTTLPNKQTKKH